MRHSRLSAILTPLLLAGALGLLAGCEPLDDGGGGGVPPTTSSLSCRDDSDCVPNACCGQGTAITHVNADDAPACSGTCSGTCPANSVECGRCIPICRLDPLSGGLRCAAACDDS